MAKRYEVYKCSICGNVVEVLTGANGVLVCCGEDMKNLRENTVDAAVEKHVPVVTRSAEGIVVKVGSAEHPMTDDHYIEWIEIIAGASSYTVFLKPGDKPEACFPEVQGDITARAYCNLHGVWKEQ